MTQPTSTANYRKYPKGPNFLLVVILSGVTLILVGIAAWLLLSSEGKKMIPKADAPHPSSQLMPNPIMPIAPPRGSRAANAYAALPS